jgi:hypothetical protein
MAYDKMNEYINTIFQVYIMVFKMTCNKNNKDIDKLKCITMVIYNYLSKLAKDAEFDLSQLKNTTTGEKMDINLVPFFEYISHNNIELFDFSKIKESDMDVKDAADVERFVLSHIYYLTQ